MLIKVCKKFFLATLGVGEKFVVGYVKNKTNTGTAGIDRRNVSSPKNLVSKRLTDDQLAYARGHTSSFPAVESHYCRAIENNMLLLMAAVGSSKTILLLPYFYMLFGHCITSKK